MVAGNELEKRTVEMAQKKGITVHRLYKGDVITLGDASIQVFRYWDIPNANARSMIERVQFGEASIWLTADITGLAQEYYVGALEPEVLKADIMKVPHHGSKYSSSENFIDVTKPVLAVFQVGRNNYGHPSEEAINRYRETGCEVVRNDTGGAIGLIIGNDKSFEVITMLN